jgi:8-oxo-dGTP pyrophosphatase MutT (NUDIX family)
MHKWISHLELLLAKELPGTLAHAKMSPTGRIDTESYLLSSSIDVRTSAVMIVLFPEDELLKMVLIKRPSYQGVHSGQISFPGGKSETTDPDYIYTALRETEEEVGIKPDKIRLLGSLSRIYIPPSNFLVYPFVGYCAQPPSFRLDQKEVEKVILPPVDLLLNNDIIKEGSFKAGGPNGWLINAPYFEVENERIWGATAAILSELKELLLLIKAE